MRQDILESTIELIAEKAELDPSELSKKTELANLDIKSLELTEIIFELEEKFDVEIELSTVTAWEKLVTISDVVDAVTELASDT